MSPAAATPPVPPARTRTPGEPYCSNCGYSLTGATDTPVCPECGRPLVEVLQREPMQFRAKCVRYKSAATIFGLPVLHIAIGPNLDTGEMRGRARGLIAIGDVAQGGIAMGGAAFGVVALGGMAIGGFTIGGLSVGAAAALGGGAFGLGLSGGGGAVGTFAAGGVAAGAVATGGAAVGYYAKGGAAFGRHVISPARSDPEAVAMFDRLHWIFGSRSAVGASTQPLAVTSMAISAAALLILLLAVAAHARARARRFEQAAGWGSRT